MGALLTSDFEQRPTIKEYRAQMDLDSVHFDTYEENCAASR